MQILDFFDSEKTNDFTVYRLREAEWDNFVDSLPLDFRLCYIEDVELIQRAAQNGISNSEFLEHYVLPDVGNVKSGDFGEMLSLFVVMENLDRKGIKVFAPRKWQWKDRNKPAPYCDGILLNIEDSEKPSTKDLLVTIESKMKAVDSKDHRIQDAIDGAILDKNSRMAKTLNWLVEKFARLGDKNSKQIVERFKDPATYGNYEKKHKAIAILDSNFEADEISKPVKNHDGLGVIVFSVGKLQQAYEQTRTNIIGSI